MKSLFQNLAGVAAFACLRRQGRKPDSFRRTGKSNFDRRYGILQEALNNEEQPKERGRKHEMQTEE
jgi:hypothetical protein